MIVSSIEKIHFYCGAQDWSGKLTRLSASDTLGVMAGTAIVYYLVQTFVCDPLQSFPGPIGAKLSRLYESKVRASGKEYLNTDGLHKQYGNIVRIGHNTLSIKDPEAIRQIYLSERFVKSPFYKALTFDRVHQLTSTADPAEHARFRKIMAPGFSQARLDELENVIMQSGVEAFLNKLDGLYADKGVACNLFIEFHCLAMDILGELAYGKSFNMIQSQRHPFTQWLRQRQTLIPLCSTYPSINDHPWLLKILLPTGYRSFMRIRKFGDDSLIECAQNTSSNRWDFTQILLNAMNASDPNQHMTPTECSLHCFMLIVAGTDTTSNSLCFTLYLLAKHPGVKNRLFNHLVRIMPDSRTVMKYKDIRKETLPYLWAIIMEATRMFPAVPGGLPRVCPEGGETIANHFIPGGTVVQVPTWSIHHDATIFPEPSKFLPERWLGLEAKGLAKYHLAFSVGPRMCAGKNLGMMEMTLTICHLLRRYDVSLVNPDEKMDLLQTFVAKPASMQTNVYISKHQK
ncbi:cytochrome P450 [Umbelopsis sp. PMI_123]|nr:cytochrome P450 [Umbelopsis sp. PMI_123]